jgi:iron complex transport system substrate-binding protein
VASSRVSRQRSEVLRHTLTFAIAAAAVFGAPAAVARPQHIMSLNLCTDELLLNLVPQERIASVTYLSRLPIYSYMWLAAAHVPVNHGLAEDALSENPDLILAGTYTGSAARSLLKKIGMPLVEIPPANSFAEIRAVTRMVAHAVGEDARGEALIARMDTTLQVLARTKPKFAIRVAAWNGGGGVPGRGTLFNAILTAAGGLNIASSSEEDSHFGIERLLFARPDVLLYGAEAHAAPALRTDADQHPILLRAFGARRITYPEVLYSCGVPESADAAKALRAGLLRAMQFPKGARE